MIKGLHPIPVQSAEIHENWRTVSEALGELYFERTYGPGIGALFNGAALVSFGAPLGISFPNAGVPLLVGPMEKRPERWQRAGFEATLWYTSPVGSTNNFAINVDVIPHDEGDVLTAIVASATISYVIPGPAVANTELKTTAVTLSTTAIAGNKDCLCFRVYRDAANASDTNANAFYLEQVLIRVLPQL